MFKSWSLKSKTMSAFTAIAFGLLIVGATGALTIRKVASQYAVIPGQDVPNIVNVSDMRADAWQMRVLANRLRTELLAPDAQTPNDIKELEKSMDDVLLNYDKISKSYEALPSRASEDAEFNLVKSTWLEVQSNLKRLRAVAHKDKAEIKEFDEIFTNDYRSSATKNLETLESLALLHKANAQKAATDASESAAFGNWLALGVVVTGFFSALATGFLFSASLTKTLSGLSERLKNGADSVAGESQKIAASSSQLSASTTEQAAALQETVSSVDEVSAMINKNADNAKQSQDVAGQSQNSASKGREAVAGLIGSIDEISQSN
ncbi:MAG: hypothetical protein EOP05_02495, partial [Proteobacteria bacterium]